MPFFTFSQNNSHGFFEGPAQYVIVEASDHHFANALAVSYGVYFDDEYDIDCECCGRRWNRAREHTADVEPSIYGTPVFEYEPLFYFDRASAEVLIVYADGRRVKFIPSSTERE